MKRSLLIAMGACLACTAQAAYLTGAETKITGVSTYASGSVAGDVVIRVQTTVAGCEAGYYIKASDPGKKEALSVALSAFHAGATVVINGNDSPRWEGSGANLCRVEGIHIVG